MTKHAVSAAAFAAASLAPAALSPQAAVAQSGPYYPDATAPLIASLLQSQGLPTQIRHIASTGDPYVRSKVDGFNFSIYFFTCTKTEPRRCKGIQFFSGYRKNTPLPLSLMNSWNRRKRYARGYLVPDKNTGQLNRARIEMDLSFSGGMHRSIFLAHYRLFRILNRSFRAHIRFNQGAVRGGTGGGSTGGDQSRGIEGLQD